MRLLDWMIRPEKVLVTGTEDTGFYASDELVIINLGEADTSKNNPAEPGIYQLKATRPAACTKRLDVKRAEVFLAEKVAEIEASSKKWQDLVWSPSWQFGNARVGSLSGQPCGINDAWLSRLPKNYVLRGYRPDKPFIIQRLNPADPIGKVRASRTNVGVVVPVKFNFGRPVFDAIVDEMTR
jgi:hypothetical protein